MARAFQWATYQPAGSPLFTCKDDHFANEWWEGDFKVGLNLFILYLVLLAFKLIAFEVALMFSWLEIFK